MRGNAPFPLVIWVGFAVGTSWFVNDPRPSVVSGAGGSAPQGLAGGYRGRSRPRSPPAARPGMANATARPGTRATVAARRRLRQPGRAPGSTRYMKEVAGMNETPSSPGPIASRPRMALLKRRETGMVNCSPPGRCTTQVSWTRARPSRFGDRTLQHRGNREILV